MDRLVDVLQVLLLVVERLLELDSGDLDVLVVLERTFDQLALNELALPGLLAVVKDAVEGCGAR